jgi:hypothetical protein
MPLRPGYSYDTFRLNVGELMRSGHSRRSALAAAYAFARVHYWKAHPAGLLPEWLAYPPDARSRKDYDINGNSRIMRNNPRSAHDVPDPAKVAKARKLYRDFTGHDAPPVRRLAIKNNSSVGLVIGQILGIMYQVDATGERFKHMFAKVAARPLLVVDHDGQAVQMRGGAYTFTERGIVDD